MKKVFIKTKNVKRFVSLMDELQNLPPNIPKIALVYGEHGLGKTQAILWWATRNDAVYIRANNKMTQSALLKNIVDELGGKTYYASQDNFNYIIRILQKEQKIILVDEVDYLINGQNTIEILRDIQDNTGVPIVLSGMGFIDKKISRYKHFEDRIYRKVKFEHFNQEDIKDIVSQLTDLNITDDGINYLATRVNQFRQLVKLINNVEKLSNTNGIEELNEYTLKGLLNGKTTPTIMQKVEKMYA